MRIVGLARQILVCAALPLTVAAEAADASQLEAFLAPTPTTVAPKAFSLNTAKQIVYWRTTINYAHTNAIAQGKPVTITLAPGTYTVPSGHLAFRAADSGTPAAPVTFRAATPGTVRILGANPLATNLFAKATLSDAHYARFAKTARGRIYVAALPTNIALHDNVFKANSDGSNPDLPTVEMLYLGGRVQDLARWPNRTCDETIGWTNFTSIVQKPSSKTSTTAFVARMPDDRAKNWQDLTRTTNGVLFHCSAPWCWHDEFVAAAGFDATTRNLTFARKLDYGYEAKTGTDNQAQRFVVVNVLEELDQPGEWWIDHVNRKLYYYPEPGFWKGEELVLVSYKDKLLAFEKGAHDIRFENITFACSERIAEVDAGSARITFDNCTFHSFRIPTRVTGTAYTFRNCSFHDFGSGVLTVSGGSRPALESCGTRIDGCTFADFERVKLTTYPAVWLRGTVGCAVRNCTFERASHGAVRIIGNENLVGWSTFRDLMRETIDSGSVYSGRNTSFLGNVTIGCRFEGSRPATTVGIPAGDTRSSGVYLDDGVWGGDIIGCDIAGMLRGFFLRGGNLHRILWNRVTDCALGFCAERCVATYYDIMSPFTASDWNSATGDNWFTSFYDGRNAKDENGKAVILDRDSPRWRGAYPTLKATIEDATYRIEPWNNRLEGNLFNGCTTAYDDRAYAGARLMSYRDNVFGATKNAVAAHIGFRALDRAATADDVPGFAAARERVAALADVAPVDVRSPGGRVRVRFGLDATARLCCRAEQDGQDVIAPSPMGVAVNGVDYGRLVLPGAVATAPAEGGRATRVTFPLVSVADGATDVVVEALVRDDGFAYRFCKVGEAPWQVDGAFFGWNLAYGADSSKVFCSTNAADVGHFPGACRTAWRACRLGGGTTVQAPELAADEVTCDGAVHKLVVTDDPGVTVQYRPAPAANVGTYQVQATPKTGYAWSDGTTGAKTMSYRIVAAATPTDGWHADGVCATYVCDGVARWQLAAGAGGGAMTLTSRTANPPTDGVLDLTGLDAAYAAAGTTLPLGGTLQFADGAGVTDFAAVKTLVITNRAFMTRLPKKALMPFTNVVNVVLGDINTDLQVGSDTCEDQCIGSSRNVFGTKTDALRTVAVFGRDLVFRNAFGSYDKTQLADVRVKSSGDVDLGWSAFNVSTGSTGGSLTNISLEAKRTLLFGGYTFRYSVASGAVVRVTAPKTATLTFDGPFIFNQFSAKKPFAVWWEAPCPVVADRTALSGCIFTWYFATEYAGTYPEMKGTTDYVRCPETNAAFFVALPKIVPLTGRSARGGWYQGQRDSLGYYSDKNPSGHGDAYWYRFRVLPELDAEHFSAFRQWLQAYGQTAERATEAQAERLATTHAAGKATTLLAEYIAGTDPGDTNSVFTARVDMSSGVPVVTWEPALNGKGVKDGVRTYRVEGVKNLGDTWTETRGDEADYQFFRVVVEMP